MHSYVVYVRSFCLYLRYFDDNNMQKMCRLMLYTAVYASFYQSGIPLVGYGNLQCTRWVKTQKAMRFSRGGHLLGGLAV